MPAPLARRVAALALACAPLAVSAIAFAPIVGNYFFADDFFGLYRMVNDPPWRFVLEPAGGHLLFLRNGVFYLSYELLGPRPEYFFGVVLLTHLANVLLLFRLILRVAGSPRLACFGASLWGTSPVNEGALGWYAVYGQVLATALVIGAVLLLVERPRVGPLESRTLVACWVLLLAASASFGVGIAAALVFPAVVLLLAGRGGLRRGGWGLAFAIPVSVAALYALHQRYQVHAYGRPLTEFPVSELASSPGLAVRMILHLFGFGVSGLMLGIPQPHFKYPGLPASLAIGLFAAGTTLAVVLSRGAGRRLLVALALLAIANYGAIAAVRAVLYPMIGVPLEGAAAVSRYHYLGALWLCVMLCVALARLAAWSGVGRLPGSALLAVWIVYAALAARAYSASIDQHVAARRETERVLSAIRTEIGATPPGRPVFITNRSFQAAGLFPMPDGTPFPGWVAVFEIFFRENTVEDRNVFFVADGATLRNVARTGRITSLLVGPEMAPGREAAQSR